MHIVNFLKKLKALFSKDKKQIAEVEAEMPEGDGPVCWWCEGTIEETEKGVSFNKKKFHVECKRLMVKQARKEMGV